MPSTFKRPSLSPRATALAIGAALAGLVLAITWLAIAVMSRQAESQARLNLAAMALVLSEHTEQTMLSAYLVLDDITDGLRQQHLSDDAALRRVNGTASTHKRLSDKAGASPQIDVASIVALNGDVIVFSRAYPTPHINLADRDYFKQCRIHPQLQSFISQPVKNRANGDWTFYLSRCLEDVQGRFIGLVLVGVSSQFFSDFYDRLLALHRSAGSTIGLFSLDGRLLAHSSVLDPSPSAPSRWITPPPGTLEPLGADRPGMAASRSLDNYPLMVRVGITNGPLDRFWHVAAPTIIGVSATALLALLTCFTLLDRSLKRRQQELAAAVALRQQAEAANLAKTRFLTTISHELRTPLGAILGFSEMLLETPLDALQRDCAASVQQAGQLLLALTEKILDFRKIETGQLALQPVVFNPAKLVDEVVRLFSAAAHNKGLVLLAKTDPALPDGVAGDALALRQVLANLVENGIKFTQAGSVVVELTTVTDHADAHQATLRFGVIDTGIGIAAAAQQAVFEPFNQIDNTLERQFGGTGLGLAICQRLVSQMGGRISLRSAPGEGSMFCFDLCLPLALAAPRVGAADA
jgi:signal transduction histidine kinase